MGLFQKLRGAAGSSTGRGKSADSRARGWGRTPAASRGKKSPGKARSATDTRRVDAGRGGGWGGGRGWGRGRAAPAPTGLQKLLNSLTGRRPATSGRPATGRGPGRGPGAGAGGGPGGGGGGRSDP